MNSSVEFVVHLFRLLKLAGLHDLENEASRRAVARSFEVFEGLLRTEEEVMNALFADETVYVNGHPIKAERQIYENAMEMGALLARMGVNEISIFRGVTPEDLTRMVKAVASRQAPTWQPGDSIRIRQIDPRQVIGADEDSLSPAEQAASVYGTTCVVLMHLEKEARSNRFGLLRQVKRLAQRIVSLSETASLELLTLGLLDAGADRAKARTHAAIIGVISARAITRDQHVLMRICFATLVGDLGTARVAGAYRTNGFGASVIPQLNSTMRQRLPASTVILLLESGRASDRAISRAVAAYESQWLTNIGELGWPYDGKVNPGVESVIVQASLKFVDFRVHQDSPDVLMNSLLDSDKTRIFKAASHLIFTALGLFPSGTPVQLQNGAQGIVAATPTFEELERPVIRLVIDEHGHKASGERISAKQGSPWAIIDALHQPSRLFEEHFRTLVIPAEREDQLMTLQMLPAVNPDPFSDHGTLEQRTEIEDLI